jgi:hypothetical protein
MELDGGLKVQTAWTDVSPTPLDGLEWVQSIPDWFQS